MNAMTAGVGLFLLICAVVMATGQASFCEFFNWRTVFAECREQIQRECDCSRTASSPNAARNFQDRLNAAPKTKPGRGWQKSGNRFFKCFNRETATYQEAKGHCASHGGRLAAEVLRDPDAASYIISHCFRFSSNTKRPWIGFDEIDQEGTWIWSDGGAMNPATTEWGETEPNNWNETDEDCGDIWLVSTNKLLLNDAPCEALLTYICEV